MRRKDAKSTKKPAAAVFGAWRALAAGRDVDSPRVRWLLWRATGDRSHLAAAKALLDRFVAHAPADCRESAVRNVRLHREIVEAARVNGV